MREIPDRDTVPCFGHALFTTMPAQTTTIHEAPTQTITYEMLAAQFGSNDERLIDFQIYFDREIKKVLRQCRDVKVEASPQGDGVILLPSNTHVVRHIFLSTHKIIAGGPDLSQSISRVTLRR